MTGEKVELIGSVDVAEDVQKKVKTVGVRGLDFKKANELGVFKRIGNMLTVMHTTMFAAYRIYGDVAYLMDEIRSRRNDIAKTMNDFEKSYERFSRFWTDYYSECNDAVMREIDMLYHRIMQWAELPENWQLGDDQRTKPDDSDIAIRIESEEEDRVYTFYTTAIDSEVEVKNEKWCVLHFDPLTSRQTVIHTDMDKSSALMVAKRMSNDDCEGIYTAAVMRDAVERRTEITPFKAFRNSSEVGNIKKMKK